MRIDPRSAPVASSASGQPRRADAQGSRFELGRAPDRAKGAAGPRSAAPLATLDALLALQEEPESPADRKRRSARRGQGILDSLDRLKAALIGGRVSPGDLAQIALRLAGAEPSGDPALDDVVAQIELRAKVELAKLGRADLI